MWKESQRGVASCLRGCACVAVVDVICYGSFFCEGLRHNNPIGFLLSFEAVDSYYSQTGSNALEHGAV